MSKKKATERNTTHFDFLGPLVKGKPRHGRRKPKTANQRGRRKGRK